MKKIVRLTERDLTRLVKRIINEQGGLPRNGGSTMFKELKKYFDICPNIPPNSLSNKYADDIYDSMDGMGTDEEKTIKTFQQFKTFNEFCATKKSYVNIYKSEMLVDIFDDNTKWDITIDQGDQLYKTLSRLLRILDEKR